MEKHTVSRLVGAPPGHAASAQGGQLTESVRRKPYPAVPFDEIEKAHREVINALLQILDDGLITDAQGRTVDFKNTVIIMTSNIGSQHLSEGAGEEGEIPDDVRDRVMRDLRSGFRPEFLNRVDDIVLFKPLTREEIKQIVDLQAGYLADRLRDRRIRLDLDEAARRHIAEAGYDPVYGARPLKRYLQRELESRLGRAIVAGQVADGSRVTVTASDGELQIETHAPQAAEETAEQPAEEL
jgi:ATP-dependent Clp protease ATP-binding subunit ClpB